MKREFFELQIVLKHMERGAKLLILKECKWKLHWDIGKNSKSLTTHFMVRQVIRQVKYNDTTLVKGVVFLLATANKIIYVFTFWSSNPTSRNLSQRYAGKNTKRRMYKATHCSTIYVIPRLELIQMSISKELGE